MIFVNNHKNIAKAKKSATVQQSSAKVIHNIFFVTILEQGNSIQLIADKYPVTVQW